MKRYNEERFFTDMRELFAEYGVLRLKTTTDWIGFEERVCEGTFHAKNCNVVLDKPGWYIKEKNL
ncbi:hypothetical protein [Sporolactobacillus terrae]|uniref:hypothetical protein n=1 Tax=Sporolactobacillus terrae TaxID=269673 RepID=UPI00048E105C|nr:hypothetical protein [Sporolactobacillus terrae]